MIKVYLTFLILIMSLPIAYAQKAFISACNSQSSQHTTIQNDIKWLKFLYKTEDCSKIGNELSKVTSLSELIQPYYDFRPEMMNSWVHSFKYVYGDLSLREAFDQWHFQHDIRHYIFKKLELYSDLPNITSLTYSRATLPFPTRLCEAIKLYPKLKTVALDMEFLDRETDKCLSQLGIRVILIGTISSLGNEYFESDIVGIENYHGDLNELLTLNNLQYLGISNMPEENVVAEPVALSILGGIPNLTHLSLTSANIARVQDLKYSFNLTWLSIACAESEYNLDKSPCAVNAPYLDNLDFMSKLTYLEHLDLSYNMLKKIPDFKKLAFLKSLILRGNLIQKLPWTEIHPSLDYLDLSGNKISSIESLSNLTSLSFLNLSGNKISDFSALNDLQLMRFLNLSNNVYQKDLSTINPGPQLKVLSLNGGCDFSDFPDNYPTEYLVAENHPEAQRYKDAIHGDYIIQESRTSDNPEYENSSMSYTEIDYWNFKKSIKCKNNEMISGDADFSKFKNLEALSLRYNNLVRLPNVSKLTNLRALNLEGNKIPSIPSQNLPLRIKTLTLAFNRITVLPDFRLFPSLMKIDLSGNEIKTIKELKLINKTMSMNLSGNQIKNVSIFDQANFKETAPSLYGNPVDEKTCPVNSKNVDFAFFCRGYRNGFSSAELDSIGN